MEPARMKLMLEKIRFAEKEIKSGIYKEIQRLSAEYALTEEPVRFEDRERLEYRPISVGDAWSDRLFDCAWFHLTAEVPAGYALEELYLGLDIEGEGCIFSENGTPVRGITNGTSVFGRDLGEPVKRYVPFTDGTFRTDKIDLWLEAGHNDLFGETHSGKILQMGIYRCNREMRELYYDYMVLRNLANAMDDRNPDKMGIYYALEQVAVNVTALASDEQIASARGVLAPFLAKKGPADPSLTFYSVGHSHLDLAWLWPIRESRRKAGRTFSTALANIKDYPDYIYGASQPQQYEWIKEDYPELYEKIKLAVKAGRIEPQGAMWVEPDTNVTGAESLVRQIYYGKRYWREEFDREVDILWIPDVFGFNGALPQIMKKSGAPNLLTIKISWNMVNQFPYHSFKWQGIDGSEVLVHMPPEGTYNSSAYPTAVMQAAGDYSERGISKCAMMLYGIGDGGGGPSRFHLEVIKREADLCGLPRVKNATSSEFFARLKTEADRLPTYKGEMYLERHQGTYTSQSKNKKYNRAVEHALARCELAHAMTAETYPFAFLDPIWKETLLYQFHDILPGSSIARVYEQTEPRYEAMLSELDAATAKRLGGKDGESVLNDTSFDRREYVKVGGEWMLAEVAPYAVARLKAPETKGSCRADDKVIENKYLKATFSGGILEGLYDKEAKREALDARGGNHLSVYEDAFDAWDTYAKYTDALSGRFELVSAEPYNEGFEAGIRFEYKYGRSTLWQRVYLGENARSLRFETTVDWQETKKMLRVDFAPNVFADEATCDIQFGSIKRPMGDNNSHEWAKYEVCAHKWIDMSERKFGVAILNDCKYGHRAKGGIISLNLLRSQMYPCVDQDKGTHTFTYAIMSHVGDVFDGGVAAEAYALNKPLYICAADERGSLIRTDNEHAVIETVKPAWDGNGFIARIYNDTPDRQVATLCGDFGAVELTDMTEEHSERIESTLTFKPYEIITVRLTK